MQLLPIPDQKLAGPHHIAFQAEKRMIHICQLLSNKVYHVKESHFKRGLALDLADYSVLYKMYHLYLCFLYNKKGYERRERSVIDECIGTAGCNRHCRSPDFYSSDLVGVASRQYRSVNQKRQSRAGKTPDDFADNRHWNGRCQFLFRLPQLFTAASLSILIGFEHY